MKHPVTGEVIVGFQIPFWNQIIELVKELAYVVPQVRYVGWNIAITEKRPILIEGNYRGMFGVQQQVDQIGKRQLYDMVLKEIRN